MSIFYYSSSQKSDEQTLGSFFLTDPALLTLSYLSKTRLRSDEDVQDVKHKLSAMFDERRQTIKSTCEKALQNNKDLQLANSLKGDKRWNMYFDYDDKLLVCTIDKVGSTNWYHQFMALGTLRNPKMVAWGQTSRDELRDVHHSLLAGPYGSLEEAASKMVTATFVRHPFQRLVSGYYDKIARPAQKFFPPVRKYILEKYRKRNTSNLTENLDEKVKAEFEEKKNEAEKIDGNEVGNFGIEEEKEFPTPYEFMLYFLDQIPEMGDVLNVNRHFAAQYTQCPFCSIEFDVLGTKETYQNDIDVLFKGVHLEKVLNSTMESNSGHANEELAQKFFSQLPREFIRKLYEYYKLDFDMFGYEVPLKYIEMGYPSDRDDSTEIKRKLKLAQMDNLFKKIRNLDEEGENVDNELQNEQHNNDQDSNDKFENHNDGRFEAVNNENQINNVEPEKLLNNIIGSQFENQNNEIVSRGKSDDDGNEKLEDGKSINDHNDQTNDETNKNDKNVYMKVYSNVNEKTDDDNKSNEELKNNQQSISNGDPKDNKQTQENDLNNNNNNKDKEKKNEDLRDRENNSNSSMHFDYVKSNTKSMDNDKSAEQGQENELNNENKEENQNKASSDQVKKSDNNVVIENLSTASKSVNKDDPDVKANSEEHVQENNQPKKENEKKDLGDQENQIVNGSDLGNGKSNKKSNEAEPHNKGNGEEIDGNNFEDNHGENKENLNGPVSNRVQSNVIIDELSNVKPLKSDDESDNNQNIEDNNLDAKSLKDLDLKELESKESMDKLIKDFDEYEAKINNIEYSDEIDSTQNKKEEAKNLYVDNIYDDHEKQGEVDDVESNDEEFEDDENELGSYEGDEMNLNENDYEDDDDEDEDDKDDDTDAENNFENDVDVRLFYADNSEEKDEIDSEKNRKIEEEINQGKADDIKSFKFVKFEVGKNEVGENEKRLADHAKKYNR